MMRIPKAEAAAIATLGVDICKNTFRPIGHKPGAIVLRELLHSGCTFETPTRNSHAPQPA